MQQAKGSVFKYMKLRSDDTQTRPQTISNRSKTNTKVVLQWKKILKINNNNTCSSYSFYHFSTCSVTFSVMLLSYMYLYVYISLFLFDHLPTSTWVFCRRSLSAGRRGYWRPGCAPVWTAPTPRRLVPGTLDAGHHLGYLQWKIRGSF